MPEGSAAAAIFAILYLAGLGATALAQLPKAPSIPQYSTVPVNQDVQLSLTLVVRDAAKSLLDRQAIVKLYDPRRKVAIWRNTTEKSEAAFYDLNGGSYEIDVSAVGFKAQHALVNIAYAQEGRRVEVFLERDPSALDLSLNDDIIPPKRRKEAERAVNALKSGNLVQAQKHLDNVYKIAPSSAQLNFLYGYLYMGLNNLDKAESFLSRAATLDPRRLQTLSVLARVQLQLQHNRDAQATLEQVIAARPSDWMAHNLLATAFLNQKEYAQARQQAQLALETGKQAASVAELPLGEALAMLGQDKEAVGTLEAFLRDNPKDPTTADVESFLVKVKEHEKAATAVTITRLPTTAPGSLPPLPDTPWGPPGIDDAKPQVAAGVVCPADHVLETSGRRVKQLVTNVSQFSATEYLVHEQLDRFGSPNSKETRRFNYIASIAEPSPGNFMVDEYRQLQSGEVAVPDGIATRGFMSLALIFHPDIRGDFEISCEGLSEWQGQAAWLMYFRQREDVPSRFGKYVVGKQPFDVRLKGRAWIRATDFEITRMESELLSPVANMSIQHQIVQYGPVHFNGTNTDLWLPKSVDLYIEINNRRYYRQHSFEQYLLFSVDAEQKLPTLKAGATDHTSPADQPCLDVSSIKCQKTESVSK